MLGAPDRVLCGCRCVQSRSCQSSLLQCNRICLETRGLPLTGHVAGGEAR